MATSINTFKRKSFFLLLSVWLGSLSLSSAMADNGAVDTVLTVKMDQIKSSGHGYSLIYLRNSVSMEKEIRLIEDDVFKGSIRVPSSDEVKNISVAKMIQHSSGFEVMITWGGGNYLYAVSFYFLHDNGEFYLNRVNRETYFLEYERSDKEIIEVSPMAPFDLVDFSYYLQ